MGDAENHSKPGGQTLRTRWSVLALLVGLFFLMMWNFWDGWGLAALPVGPNPSAAQDARMELPGTRLELSGARMELVVAATGDLNGWVTGKKEVKIKGKPRGGHRAKSHLESRPAGLAHLAGPLARLRRDYPVVLLDGGDSLTGSVQADWYLTKPEPPPILKAMNFLGYDGAVPGNRDLEMAQNGGDGFRRRAAQGAFPWLGANVEPTSQPEGPGQPLGDVLRPYLLIQRGGAKVAVVGLVTPGVELWLDENNRNWRVKGMAQAARRWVPFLKTQAGADVVVGLVHAGLRGESWREDGLRRGTALPNGAGELADMGLEGEAGFDLIISAHGHRLSPRTPKTGWSSYSAPVVEAGSQGDGLAVAKFSLVKKQGRWAVARVVRWSLPPDPSPDPTLMAALRDPLGLRREAQLKASLTRPVGVWLHKRPRGVRVFQRCLGKLAHQAAAGLETAGVKRADRNRSEAHRSSPPVSLLPINGQVKNPLKTQVGRPITRAVLAEWFPYDSPLVAARLTPRQMEILLAPYGRWLANRKTPGRTVLVPGGMEPRRLPGGTMAGLEANGKTLPPHQPILVWMTNHDFRGAGSALVQPNQPAAHAETGLREMVARTLNNPAALLPAACRPYLSRTPP